jgi:hypothetical protein
MYHLVELSWPVPFMVEEAYDFQLGGCVTRPPSGLLAGMLPDD